MAKIVAIDDDRSALVLFQNGLASRGHQVWTASNSEEGLKLIRAEQPDVILLDVMLRETTGLQVFQAIREIDRKLPVIFITAGSNSDVAIEAMQLGAYDYVTKPINMNSLAELIERAARTRELMNVPVALGADPQLNPLAHSIIGRSPQMLDVFKAIGRVARQNVTVLIRGESGTGKELVARALYQHSGRADRPFMEVNCAALPDTLLESELFGHEKGSFTGADKRRIGKFEQCDGGTIFLDEVGDMAPIVQGKVLRLLQEQRFERVGGNETIQTDVRIVAATNRPLDKMVEEGLFRPDLLYRLNSVTIQMPLLRDRGDDVKLLLQYFLGLARKEFGKPDVEGISPAALEMLLKYPWPGNVRELQAVIRQAVLNTTGTVVVPDSLPPEFSQTGTRSHAAAAPAPAAAPHDERLPTADLQQFIESRLSAGSHDLYAETLEMMERFLITRVLQETEGNQSRAAEVLGITRGKIRDRIAAFNISLDKNISIANE